MSAYLWPTRSGWESRELEGFNLVHRGTDNKDVWRPESKKAGSHSRLPLFCD